MNNDWNKKITSILSRGLFLNDLGINNWGLTKLQALNSFEDFLRLSIPVLGGDVLISEGERLVHTYDNWYCDRNEGETFDSFVIRSNKVAMEYVKNYSFNDGEKVLFVFVPENTLE